MSFSIYQSLRPSTSVDHTAACAFTQPGAEELVICRVNVLEVWRPSPIQNQMQLAMQFDLPGEVNSLQKFPISLDAFTLEEQQQWKHRLPERGLDCLVLAFDEAKISLVCFDPTKPRVLKTCALFNFEDSARGSELRATKVGLLPCPPSQFGSRAFALVDPQYRCIAMVVYSSFVAVIPIRQILLEEEDDAKQELIRVLAGSDDEGSSSEEEDDDDGDEEQDRAEGMDEEQQLALQRLRTNRPVSFGGRVLKKSSALKRECGNDHPMFGTPHLLPLSAFEVGQHTAISACFAENSFTPTLLVLYTDPIRTWAPRVHVYANTCNVCAISLCAENPLAATKAWQATNLPHDALNLIPVKSGGALVVCTNALVYINSVPRERVTMAVNAFANVSCLGTRSNPIYNTKGGDATGEEEDDLDTSFAFASTSAVVWITKQTLLCVLARGELLQVCLNAGQGNLMRMTCKLVGAVGGTVFTCAALLPVKQLLFFGSRSTDGVFLTYAQEEQVVLPTENKRVKLEDEVSYVPLDEDFVPQDADAEVDEQSLTLLLEIVDYLPVLGPITDMDFADALPTNPFNLERARQEDQQIIARAEREYAELMAIHRSNQANQARERGELLVRENRRKREQEPIRRDVDLVTVGSKTRVDPKCFAYSCGYRVNIRQTLSLLECSMLFALNAHTLVVSGSNKTRVFSLSLTADAAGQVVEQKQHSLCNPNQATLFTSTLRGSIKGVVQVLPQELRLFASKGLLKQRFALNKHQHIVQVVFEANVLFLVLANASLKAFQITEDFQFKPVDEFATNVASLACFVCPTTGKLTAMCVLNGDGGKESGTLEIYEDFKLVFRGDHPLPLSPTCVSNALGQNIAPLTDADKAHRAGVLLNCPVVDLLASRVGTETNFKILLLAALGDGELCVFERWGDRGERWYRVNHNLITRGLRGRQSRPRKYAQPSKAFRGPVLHSFVLDNSRRVFFGGHRPCMIFCHLGRVSAVPLAGSVSCLLPPPLVPVAAAVKSTASAPGGAAAAVVATAILEEEVCVLGARTRDQARGAVEIHRLVVCTSALSGAQDFTGGIPASVHQVPHPETSWNCTHVVYLPHASRGSKVEQALGLHAPTFALISSRDET
ncbi:hypothetical protein BASA81_000616 [Batrachochytrium salamandrivorans]|nr:hypothetical protein BASA81_000616 [Batrachochytrium salamandrivorans]